MAEQRLFRVADRAFWLIWLGFPVLVWAGVRHILTGTEQLAAMAPQQAACLADFPQVQDFTLISQLGFWGMFGFENAVYLVLLGLAHHVIHRCASGRVFVAEVVTSLRRIGWVIALFPVVDLAFGNAVSALFVAMGDLAAWQANLALDLPVVAVGVLLIVMAAAMRMALRLHHDAALTI